MNSAIKEFNNVAFHNNNLLDYFCKKKNNKNYVNSVKNNMFCFLRPASSK